MAPDKIQQGPQHIDVHLDLPPETVEEIRSGKKSVSIIDSQTKDRIHVCQGSPGAITWKQVSLAFGIIAAIVGNSLMIGSKMQKFETATESITELQKNVTIALNVAGQHGQEFAALRTDLSTLMNLYDRIDANINVKTSDRYTGQDATKDWAQHAAIHTTEDKALQSQLLDIRRSLERLEQYHRAAAHGD